MKTSLFTVIELMVVVAILALLAGMILPAIEQAKWKVRYNNWQEQTGKTCELPAFEKAFIGFDEKKVIVKEDFLLSCPDKMKESPKGQSLYELWKGMTGNPKEFPLQDFEVLVEEGALEEFSFPFYVKTTGNPRKITETEFNALRKHGRIDFPSIWVQYKSIPRLEKE